MGTEEVMPTHLFTFIEGCLIARERLRQQDLYADRDSAGDKALVMKQFLSDEKVDIWTTVFR